MRNLSVAAYIEGIRCLDGNMKLLVCTRRNVLTFADASRNIPLKGGELVLVTMNESEERFVGYRLSPRLLKKALHRTRRWNESFRACMGEY